MPKMFLHAPKGAFTPEARARVAAELTELGMACERLIDTPQIRAGIWVYFVEHAPDTVFRAGRQAAEPIMSLKVYALKGGFNAETKTRMVAEATAILGKYSKTDHGEVPAYIGILEVPERELGHVRPTGSPGGDADQGMIRDRRIVEYGAYHTVAPLKEDLAGAGGDQSRLPVPSGAVFWRARDGGADRARGALARVRLYVEFGSLLFPHAGRCNGI